MELLNHGVQPPSNHVAPVALRHAGAARLNMFPVAGPGADWEGLITLSAGPSKCGTEASMPHGAVRHTCELAEMRLGKVEEVVRGQHPPASALTAPLQVTPSNEVCVE